MARRRVRISRAGVRGASARAEIVAYDRVPEAGFCVSGRTVEGA